MPMLFLFLLLLLGGQSLAVLNNGQQDLAFNKAVGYYGTSNQLQSGILRPPKDNTQQQGFSQNTLTQDTQDYQQQIPAAITQNLQNPNLNNGQTENFNPSTSLEQNHQGFRPSLQNVPATLNQKYGDGIHSSYEYSTSSQQNVPTSKPQNQRFKETSPHNVPNTITQDQKVSYQTKKPSPQQTAASSTQFQQSSYQYKEPFPQHTAATPAQFQQGPYQYNGPSPENTAEAHEQGQQGSYQNRGPSPQNPTTQEQQGPYQYKGPSPENAAANPVQNQQGPYLYKGPSPQNIPAAPTQNQQGPYQYNGPSPQNVPATATQNQQGSYQYKGPSPQNGPPTVSVQDQQGSSIHYNGASQQNFGTNSSQYQHKPQNSTLQTSQNYPQFNRPHQPYGPTSSNLEQNPVQSQKYLPPSTGSSLHQPSDYPKPSQHYLPPVSTDNATSQISSTSQQLQNPYQQYLSTTTHNQSHQHFNHTIPENQKSTTSSYYGPSHQYLPATTERPNRTTPSPSHNAANYFGTQHWNPIKPHHDLQTTTINPLNKQGPVAIHQGYRYNTPAMKQPSYHSQTFNAVIYNELGMGLNTSQYYFVPRPSSLGKTEVETQHGYIYGRPDIGANENLDSVTHLIPVPTMPSTYIYYKPTKKFGNLINNHEQRQEYNGGNSRPSSEYPANQKESNGNSKPSSSYAGNHQISNGNSRPSSQYPAKQQESYGNSQSSTNYVGNHQNPSLQQLQQIANGNLGQLVEYPANQKHPSLEGSKQSFENSRPLSEYPVNQKRQSLEENYPLKPQFEQQIQPNLNGNSRPLSHNSENHRNPYVTDQNEAHGSLEQSRPSLSDTNPAIHQGQPPQYSVPESAGNFRPSTGVPSYYQPSGNHSHVSPNYPSHPLERPQLPQYSQNHRIPTQQNTFDIPSIRPNENHMLHHPGAMENTGTKVSSSVFAPNPGKISSLNQIANNSPVPQREPPNSIYAQYDWSQSQRDKVVDSSHGGSSQYNPFHSNSLPVSPSFSQGYIIPNQQASPPQGSYQNSQLLSQNLGTSPIKQTDLHQNPQLSSTAYLPPSYSQLSSSGNHQISQLGQISHSNSSGFIYPQSNQPSPQGSSNQHSQSRPTSSKMTFPNNQISSQGNTNIVPESQTLSTQNPQQNFQTPSQIQTSLNRLNSKYPPLPQTERQKQIAEIQRLTTSLSQPLNQNLNTAKQFPPQSHSTQNLQETFLANPNAAPQVPSASTISNFFGTSGNVPASPNNNEHSLNPTKPQHKPMTFVDTEYLQMPSQNFELPSYYPLIPRGLPPPSPLAATKSPVNIKGYPLQKLITPVVALDDKPLVSLRTSIVNSNPSTAPLANPVVFVESPVVPQEPIRQPHLLYGSPQHGASKIYLPPSGVVQPPYYKK